MTPQLCHPLGPPLQQVAPGRSPTPEDAGYGQGRGWSDQCSLFNWAYDFRDWNREWFPPLLLDNGANRQAQDRAEDVEAANTDDQLGAGLRQVAPSKPRTSGAHVVHDDSARALQEHRRPDEHYSLSNAAVAATGHINALPETRHQNTP